MVRLVLWVRMVGFTALFVAVAVGYLSYRRRPFGWLRSFLVLLSAQAVFDLVFTFVFFSDLMMGETGGNHPAFTVLQAAVSMLLLYTVPRFVQRLLGAADRKGARLWGVVPVAVLIVGYVFVVMPVPFNYDVIITTVFYLYLTAWFLFGLLGRGRFAIGSWDPWITAFLAVAALYHLFAGIEVALGPFPIDQDPLLPSILLTSSLFNAFWAAMVIIPGIRLMSEERSEVDGPTVTGAFVREFKLSPRESEVLAELCSGLSNRDIAERLYVSPRTVENHVYNLYRKCNVKRRLELCNMVKRYQEP